ncbi:MAG: hypothetical protein HYZ25_15375 [Chloroflexi bacterium]|nr:hypothetical protein [Chloroflexota bacterium]
MSDEKIVKLKLKTSHVEIDYEGSEEFLRSELLSLITEVAEIHRENPPIGIPQRVDASKGNATGEAQSTINLSMKSIAAKLSIETGTDLALAACAYLAIVKGLDTFNRKDILESMKSAANFYKQTYRSNLSSYLDALIKDGKLLHQANEVYALQAQVKNEIEAKLGY